MTEQIGDESQLWARIVEMLTDSSKGQDLGLAPLNPAERGLLRLVKPGGQMPGFFVLETDSDVAAKIVNAKFKEPIEQALLHLTGEETEAVVTVEIHAEQQGTGMPTQPAPHTQPAVDSNSPESSTRVDYVEPGRRQAWPKEDASEPLGLWDDQDHPTAATKETWPSANDGSNAGHARYTNPGRSQSQPQNVRPANENRKLAELGNKLGVTLPPPRISGGADNPDELVRPDAEPTLNPKYTFDTFVTGPQNQFAAAAAVAVAEAPARAYNPLFISGGSGLGKTHLLHAIGHYTRNLYPNLRVRYVSSEEFTNDFINSVRDDAQESFKRRYRDLDMLIIDDIQFLEGKEGTQEEFFHTFNALHQADRQIVLSSDRPPRELKTLEDRLRTRFEWGLTPDLQFPDLETRTAILSKKAQLDKLQVPPEVLQYIAEHTSSSIRELEGRLLQVTAQASLLRVPVTMALAEDIIGADAVEATITPEIIIAATADYFDLRVSDLLGTGKTRPVAHARQVAMYLTRSLIDISLPAIGKHFGNRDHSTVLHAYKKISAEIAQKKPSKDQINELTTQVRERARNQV